MPGCTLRVAGINFDPDSFLASSSLRACSVWRRGEPLSKAGRNPQRVHEWSGFACDVSSVDGDLDGQIVDASSFLSSNRADLARLVAEPTVEDSRLHFGLASRVGKKGVAVQGEWLPVEFLELVAELKIGVALSIYPASTK